MWVFPCRSPRGLSRSPWAVKKINSKCNRSQQSIYQQRLNEEAKILKNLQHPNIVGKFPAQPVLLQLQTKLLELTLEPADGTRGCCRVSLPSLALGSSRTEGYGLQTFPTGSGSLEPRVVVAGRMHRGRITACLPQPYASKMGCQAACAFGWAHCGPY